MSTDVRVSSGLNRQFVFTAAQNKTISAPAASNSIYKESPFSSFQLISAAAATVLIQGSNEDLTGTGTNTNWVLVGTITLAGAGTDGFVTQAPWKYVRANVTVASATTSVLMGV
jgi:hypothetical protein